MPSPKVLFFDIETAPIEGWTWTMYDTSVVAVKRPTYMLAWAAKWQHEKKVLARILPDYPLYNKDPTSDAALVKELHGLLDQADIVIAHNIAFDVKKVNARFLANGMGPPSPFKTFCTLALARKHFKFDSNRLDALGGYLGVGRKVKHTGINLWLGCMDGDAASWGTMRKYNAQDCLLLQSVFEKMKGFSTNFPDLNMWTGANKCPTCQSGHITMQGRKPSKAGWRQQFKCQSCGGWFTLGKAVKEAA